MRLTDTYELSCAKCEEDIVTEEPSGVCPNCGTPFSIIWQASKTAVVFKKRVKLARVRKRVARSSHPRKRPPAVAVGDARLAGGNAVADGGGI